MSEKILRLKKLSEKIDLKSTAIYALVKSGDFPKQIRVGVASRGWLESEVDEWIKQRVAERAAS